MYLWARKVPLYFGSLLNDSSTLQDKVFFKDNLAHIWWTLHGFPWKKNIRDESLDQKVPIEFFQVTRYHFGGGLRSPLFLCIFIYASENHMIKMI